jgi:hypothetical protein
MIYCFCPDMTIQSAGLRMLYRHVQILLGGGIDAAILHQTPGFRVPDMPADVPVASGGITDILKAGDILVIPEAASPNVLAFLSRLPIRRIIVALNLHYIYLWLAQNPQSDWRTFNVERVITHSPLIADYVQWAMRLPADPFVWAINPHLYFPTPGEKIDQIAFIKRKQEEIPLLMHLLWSRNPQYVDAVRWLALDGLSENQYAAEIRRSQLFLNLSHAEGLPCSVLEAMRAGTLVAGWNSVGGKHELIPTGPQQNGIFVENLDYPALARALEPVLQAILRGDLSPWNPICATALACSQAYNETSEIRSVLALWHTILGR